MDARSLVKSLHPLEVKLLLRYGPGDELDSSRLQAELSYKEGQANQAFSWLSAKGLAVRGRPRGSSNGLRAHPPRAEPWRRVGTPEERILRFLSGKGPSCGCPRSARGPGPRAEGCGLGLWPSSPRKAPCPWTGKSAPPSTPNGSRRRTKRIGTLRSPGSPSSATS